MSAALEVLNRVSSLELYSILSLVGSIIGLVSLPFILAQRRGRPMAALAWILAVFALPVLGVVLWWTIGFNHLRRKRKWKKRSALRIKSDLSELRSKLAIKSDLTAQTHVPAAIQANDYGVFPPTDGNAVELLVDGEEAFPAMLEAIATAQHHVHFQFYIWRPDTWGHRFRDALSERARAGISVRTMYDDLGSRRVNRHFLRPLREAGARCVSFLPNRILRGRWSVNFRNHRKILVVDGKVAFIGGINIGDEYASTGWRDFMVRLSGPVIDQIQEVFTDDWFFGSGGESLAERAYFGRPSHRTGNALCSVVASGPDTESQETLDALFIALNSAQHRVELMTPYFVPDRTILMTLRALCIRGVKVTLITPGQIDHRIVQWASRSYYRELLAAGVAIYEYRHAMLHGKAIVIDDAVSFVGSANLDQRSFRLNFEASVFIRDRALNQALSAVFRETRAQSDRVRIEDYPEAHGLRAALDALAQLASPLL